MHLMRGNICSVMFWIVLGIMPVAAQPDRDWTNVQLADTVRLDLLDSLAKKVYWTKQPDSGQYYAEQMHRLAKSGDHGLFIRRALRYKAEIYYKTGDYLNAIPAYKSNIAAYEAADYDQEKRYRALSSAHRNLAYSLRKVGRTSESLEQYERSIAYAKDIGAAGLSRLGSALNGLGNLYFNLRNYDLAKAKFIESLDIHREIEKEKGIYSNLNNLGLVAAKTGNYAEAIQYYEESLVMKRANGDQKRIANTLGSIGDIYLIWGRETEAKGYFLEALTIQTELGLRDESTRSLTQLGELALLQNQPQVAIGHCEKARAIAQADGLWQASLACEQCLYQAYKAAGRSKDALLAHENYITVKDSIFSLENAQEIAQLEARFVYEQELAEAEAEQAQLKAEAEQAKLWRWVLLGGMLAFAGISWLIYRVSRIRRQQNLALQAKNEQIARDRALIRQQADELVIAMDNKNRFFTNISHEFRTPLTLVISPLQRLLDQEGVSLPATAQQTLQSVQSNANTLLQLVEELLDLAQLDAGIASITEQAVSWPADLQQLHERFVAAAEDKGISFRFNYEGPEHTITTDGQRLEKIVNNLLANALKFTPEGGQIQFSTTLDLDQPALSLTIKDSGRGIPTEELDQVFDRFYQVGQGFTSGTGIGLALVKESVDLLGGEVSVRSEFGLGSIFSVVLPIQLTELVPQVSIPSGSEKTPVSKEHPILIVEDHLELQRFLRATLTNYPCQVADNGQTALTILRQAQADNKPIQLVITDLMMPEMDGQTLVQSIKQDPALQATRIIVLTARQELATKLNLLRIGVDDYLVKPFVAEELITRIDNLLSFLPVASNDSTDDTGLTGEQDWLKSLERQLVILLQSQQELSASSVASAMHMSNRQLLRKIKQFMGMSTQQYLQETRLQYARQLLERGQLSTVTEVSVACGFKNPGYFTRIFTSRFGRKPSSYFE